LSIHIFYLEADKVAHREAVKMFYEPAKINGKHTLIVTDNGYLCGIAYNSIKEVVRGDVIEKWIKEDFTKGSLDT
jgi:hypothetical protein